MSLGRVIVLAGCPGNGLGAPASTHGAARFVNRRPTWTGGHTSRPIRKSGDDGQAPWQNSYADPFLERPSGGYGTSTSLDASLDDFIDGLTMRFLKQEIIDEFDRQDRSYRLAIISSHWLQGGTQYNPSAVDEARGLRMKALDTWISYSDLADLLEQDATRFAITTDFTLNQLHALIRSPFELLSDYCAARRA